MDKLDAISITVRVSINCIVFACFLFIPFKTRLRFSYTKTAILTLVLTIITVLITIFFLTTGNFFVEYSSIGVLLWLISAMCIFRVAIKGSSLELLFIVLVILNLYVNILSIAKVILNTLNINLPDEMARSVISILVLAAYIPLIWILIVKLYMQIIEFNIAFSFWRFIWIIPALTYLIFFVKIVNDYWRNPIQTRACDIAFVVLWSFTSYVFFYVTLQMLSETYKGTCAIENMHLISSQLKMQEAQYEELLDGVERTERLRHDWRHHLILIDGFVKSNDISALQDYINVLIPEYLSKVEMSVCPNHIVDIILQHNRSICETHGIAINIEAKVPKSMPVQDTDLCIVFGNLVENAVEACVRQKKSNLSIDVKADVVGNQLVLFVKNPYNGNLILKNNVYYSTKHEGKGIGLTSVKKVAEKYDGFLKTDYRENFFCVYVLLYLNSDFSIDL